MEIINPIVWRGDSFDRWCWMDEKTNTYIVQSGYWAMKAIPDIPRNDCLSKVWSLKVPRTTKVFGWRVSINRLLSKMILKREGLGFRVIYVLCATRMQNLFSILCYHVRFTVISNNIASHFPNFYLTRLSAQVSHVWRGIWLKLAKAIWMYKNRVIFEGGQVDEVEIFSKDTVASLEIGKI